MSNFSTKLKQFFGFEPAPILSTPVTTPLISTPPEIKSTFNATIIHNKKTSPSSSSMIRIEQPRIYEDSLAIATHLRNQTPVIVDVQFLDSQAGKRLIDFICGTSYAINGNMLKISEFIFLFTPNSIAISESSEKTELQKGIEENEQAQLKDLTA